MISFTVKRDFRKCSDDRLVSYVLKGNQDAVVYFFYEKFSSTFQYHIYKLFDAKVEVSDLVDEFFLYLYEDNWRRLRMYDSSKAALSTWISSVSFRFFRDYKRSKIDLNGLITISDKWESFRGDWVESIDRGIELDIRNSIDAIKNERDRRIAEKIFLEDKDPQEVSKEFRMTVDYVYTLKNRLSRQIRKKLEDYV